MPRKAPRGERAAADARPHRQGAMLQRSRPNRGRPYNTPVNDAPSAPPYAGLTPDVVLHAVESTGFLADGHQLALNSYENRVYQVGLEEDQGGPLGEARFLVAKFYRCLLYTSPSPRDRTRSRMPSSA